MIMIMIIIIGMIQANYLMISECRTESVTVWKLVISESKDRPFTPEYK